MEVDYDKNVTRLYEAICNCDWDVAIQTAKYSPREAQTWVVRHYEQEYGEQQPQIMWRFLPIHSACARQPPSEVISALLQAYPDGARSVDDQGMYPIHYACGNMASREVIRLLLMAFPQSATVKDPRNMLPIHYLACWGPSSVDIVAMLMVANRDVVDAKDSDGKTPLDLARDGDYEDRADVIAALTRWVDEKRDTRTPSPSLMARTPSPSLMARTPSPSLKLYPAAAVEKDKTYHIVTQLRQEISKVKSEMRQVQAKEEKPSPVIEELNGKIWQLVLKHEDAKEELTKTKEQNAVLDRLTKERESFLQSTEDLLAESTRKQGDAQVERDEIVQQIAEKRQEIVRCQKKTDGMRDRLGGVANSLKGLMEMQATLVRKVHDRDERFDSETQFRKAKIQEMMAFERRLKNTIVDDMRSDTSSGILGKEFEQQRTKMEAIAGLISNLRH